MKLQENLDCKQVKLFVKIVDLTLLNFAQHFAVYLSFALSVDFGLVVKQFGDRTTVIAPSTYANLVCGICGDWNGDVTNDFDRDLSVFQEPESIGAE